MRSDWLGIILYLLIHKIYACIIIPTKITQCIINGTHVKNRTGIESLRITKKYLRWHFYIYFGTLIPSEWHSNLLNCRTAVVLIKHNMQKVTAKYPLSVNWPPIMSRYAILSLRHGAMHNEVKRILWPETPVWLNLYEANLITVNNCFLHFF